MVFPKGRGDGRLMTGLVRSKPQVSVCPLLSRSMNGMTAAPAVGETVETTVSLYNITMCVIPVQFDIPDSGPKPGHVNPGNSVVLQ